MIPGLRALFPAGLALATLAGVPIRRLVLALGIAAALGLGATRVVQYRLYVPTDYRDAAVWIGPTGVGRPGLSEAQRQARQREEAYRRIGEAQLRRLGSPCPPLIHAASPDLCRGSSQ